MLDSDNVEKLFTFAEMENAKKKTNNSFYEFPGRIPPDAVRARSLTADRKSHCGHLAVDTPRLALRTPPTAERAHASCCTALDADAPTLGCREGSTACSTPTASRTSWCHWT